MENLRWQRDYRFSLPPRLQKVCGAASGRDQHSWRAGVAISSDFLGRNNYFINELGCAMIFPNVRGSAGYGKTFVKLDNGL